MKEKVEYLVASFQCNRQIQDVLLMLSIPLEVRVNAFHLPSLSIITPYIHKKRETSEVK